jgi:cobalt-zinc-cadmium efflux system protein
MNDHAHEHSGTISTKLVAASVATLLFVGFELGVGIWSNSLSLISDALHNFTDALALMIALAAVLFERRPPTPAKSFGYQRAGVLAAFINAGTLVAFTVYIVIEAIQRFRQPEHVDSSWMVRAAAAAVVLNVGITLALRREGKTDLNIRGAVIHMLGDAVSSVGIIVAGLLIRETGNPIFDPLISLVIGALILWSAWGIFLETVNLLLEGTPKGIDPEAVTADLASVAGVLGVHHLHIWALAPSRPALSCHVQLGDVSLKSTGAIFAQISAMLGQRYRIAHTTIQFEHAGCPEDDPFCAVPETLSSRQPNGTNTSPGS